MKVKTGFGDIRKLRTTAFAAMLVFCSACLGDTFEHLLTREVVHGFATTQTKDGKTMVHTQEKGSVELNLSRWQITADRLGRDNRVIVLTVDSNIMLEIETEALVEAIARASDKGPLFILLEIDTPGGRTDYTRRICAAITGTWNCEVIAFTKGGTYGGAMSAGAAIAFACDKIYMAKNTAIGAAATVAITKGNAKDVEEAFGEEVGEKISSAWRAYLASLAEQNNRPALLASAMVDKELEVIEVQELDKRLFIEPVNKRPQQQLVHTWSSRGSLLTMTAEDAVKCGIADKVVKSRRELLRYLKAENAQVVIDDSFQKAGRQFNRAKLRYASLTKSLDLNIKQMEQTDIRVRALRLLRDIRKDYKSLITLAKRYPDLQVNVALLERQLNTAEAMYKEMKIKR